MEILKYIILVIYIIVCIALIILAAVQNSEKQGASGTITGSSTNNFYEQNKRMNDMFQFPNPGD